MLTVQGVMPRDADFKQTLCADSNGFSLHAAVRCGADDRQALEQLCRYITRPALANGSAPAASMISPSPLTQAPTAPQELATAPHPHRPTLP